MRIISDDEEINRAWENIKPSSKDSLLPHELKKQKPLD